MNKFSILDATFSYFDAPLTNVIPSKEMTVEKVLPILRKDTNLSMETMKLRATGTDRISYSDLKKTKFPYATFSGRFTRRNNSNLTEHSGLICIDLDHLGKDLDSIRKKVEEDLDHVVLSFISPGGDGLKVIYPVDIKVAPHEKWVKVYEEHLRKITENSSLKVDAQCRDVARACLIPHDSFAFLNPHLDPEIQFDVLPVEYQEFSENLQISYESDNSASPHKTSDIEQMCRSIQNWRLDFSDPNSDENFVRIFQSTRKKIGEYGRSRNMWVLQLASRCNCLGMDENRCVELVSKYLSAHPGSHCESDPLNVKYHFISPIKSAYSYTDKHGIWEKFEIVRFETPELPPMVYEALPQLISDGCNLFADRREKDIFFLALLTVLSSCLEGIKGIYDKQEVESNMFLLIVAAAASGKGTMKWALKAMGLIQAEYKQQYETELKIFESNRDSEDKENLKKPIRKSPIIPGNISVSAMIQALYENFGRGLVFETEADTIANTMKNDWGNYSDHLRKSFHHERISSRRKTDNQFFEIEYPCLSVLLSGTPSQVGSLLGSTENGLFSRFLFYQFKTRTEWKNVFDNENEEIFNNYVRRRLPEAVLSINLKCKALTEVQFGLSANQQREFYASFEQWLLESEYLLGEACIPTLKRLGLFQFRIAMILTATRSIDDIHSGVRLICSDDDFKTSMAIVECLKLHAFRIIAGMTKREDVRRVFSNEIQSLYFMSLPKRFSRAEADERARAQGIKLKTSEKYLTKYVEMKLLKRIEHGEYEKTPVGNNLREQDSSDL
jgi:hypothetical protein